MTFKEIAMSMWPVWVLGLTILAATFVSRYKHLIRVEKKAVKFFSGYLVAITLFRLLTLATLHRLSIIPVDMKAIQSIPWQAGLFVFWEDAVHVLPLIILGDIVSRRKYMKLFYYACVFLMMLDFGLGHIYQSIWAAALMMLYIPTMMKIGKQYGVGTIMVCHTMFDLTAMATVLLAMKGH